MNLFERLRKEVGCTYLGDLQCGKTGIRAKEQMKKINFEKQPLNVLSDMAEFLYGCKVEFKSADEAKEFFVSEGKPAAKK